jgi:hypothetical protein
MIKIVVDTLEYIKASPEAIAKIDREYSKLITKALDLIIILENI